eukprot:1086536-Rhodomonas_salina.1
MSASDEQVASLLVGTEGSVQWSARCRLDGWTPKPGAAFPLRRFRMQLRGGAGDIDHQATGNVADELRQLKVSANCSAQQPDGSNHEEQGCFLMPLNTVWASNRPTHCGYEGKE